MSEKNMELWRSVEKTNPAHTKKVTFGRAITAIDPYRQIEAATNAFGPAGCGWGWEVKLVEKLPTNEMAVLVSLWHGDMSKRIEQWGQASLFIDKAEQKKDTDCFKKATTDGITKCLSYIGFNADVFLGKFDDNKYVQDLNKEMNPPAPKPEPTMHDRLKEAIAKAGYASIKSWADQVGLDQAGYQGLNDSSIEEYLTCFAQGQYNV